MRLVVELVVAALWVGFCGVLACSSLRTWDD